MRLFAPFINDISTDTADPPQFSDGAARPLSKKVAEAIRRHYSELAPLRIDAPPETAFRLVLEAAELMPRWKLTVIDREARVLEGFALTSLLRFRDDFVVRVRAEGKAGSIVDMRSRSRTGRSDFGANSERIAAFFEQVRKVTP